MHNTQECPASEAQCPHCDAPDLTRASLGQHLTHDCPETPTTCPHLRFGCAWEGRRADLAKLHLSAQCSYEPLKEYLVINEQELARLKQTNNTLEDDVSGLSSICRDLTIELSTLKSRLGIPEQSYPSSAPSTISDSIASLSGNVTSLTHSSDEIKRNTEQALREIQSDTSVLQMALHDIRADIVAIQQAQYHESALRFWTQQQGPALRTESRRSSGSSGTDDEKAASNTSNQIPSPAPSYFSPFPPYPPYTHPAYAVPSHTSLYHMAPVPTVMHPNRRLHGWLYPGFPAGPPDVPHGGGGTKL